MSKHAPKPAQSLCLVLRTASHPCLEAHQNPIQLMRSSPAPPQTFTTAHCQQRGDPAHGEGDGWDCSNERMGLAYKKERTRLWTTKQIQTPSGCGSPVPGGNQQPSAHLERETPPALLFGVYVTQIAEGAGPLPCRSAVL